MSRAHQKAMRKGLKKRLHKDPNGATVKVLLPSVLAIGRKRMLGIKSRGEMDRQGVGPIHHSRLVACASAAGCVMLGMAGVWGMLGSETAHAQKLPDYMFPQSRAEEAAQKKREEEKEKALAAEREKARQATAAERARRLKAEEDAAQAAKDKAAAEAKAEQLKRELDALKKQSTPQPPQQQQPATVTVPVATTPVATPATARQAFEPEMVLIPEVSFTEVIYDGEKPTRRVVTVHSFEMGKYEVTQGQWNAVMGSNPSSFKNCGDDCPVEQVNWDDIQQFIQKLNQMTGKQYRLPSGDEWYRAALAGCTTKFNVGGQCRDKIEASEANFNGNYTYNGSAKGVYREKTMPVGSFQPNTFGLYDMHGNVMEWVQDCFGAKFNKDKPTDGSPHGGNDSSCKLRLIRGGHWGSTPERLKAGLGLSSRSEDPSSTLGFRLARTVL